MVVRRKDGAITHHQFRELPELLSAGDCLAFNNTRVLRARLVGRRAATGGRWEGLFLRAPAPGVWELMCQTRGRLQPGESIRIDGGDLSLVLREQTGGGRCLSEPLADRPALELLERFGRMPLPPYIEPGAAERLDPARYQTVFAAQPGAVAAPTAGLHFTHELLGALGARGVQHVWLTLHVGPGTFQPIRESLEAHAMHAEWGELTAAAAERMRGHREAGGRLVAVGTTCVRLLETAAEHGALGPWRGETSIFIRPPYRFRVVDALLTNFHLPRSTLLALVCAFAGEELCRAAYEIAIRERYRFYSFGDAMVIV